MIAFALGMGGSAKAEDPTELDALRAQNIELRQDLKTARGNVRSWYVGFRVQQRAHRKWRTKAKRLIRKDLARRSGRVQSSARHLSGGGTVGAIMSVFGSHGSEAVSVARCESNLNVYARNGQYLGLFQMGDYARSRYGHSWNAWGQSRSAYAYFRDAGWSPWECQP